MTHLNLILLAAIIIFFLLYLWKKREENTLHVAILRYASEKKSMELKIEEELKSQAESKKAFEKLAAERDKINYKRQKLMVMSETVFEEKGKIEAQHIVLNTEKAKLSEEKKKVDEKVKKLWQQSVAIHKEMERIDVLRKEIEEKHKEIIDSVNYARLIQEAILPPVESISNHFPDAFVLFMPRDIVSGDFYWFSEKQNYALIAAVDCTGHGVPGAFMSMLGTSLLTQTANEETINDPGRALQRLDEQVRYSLKQYGSETETRDGMDLAFLAFHKRDGTLNYAGANRPLWIVRQQDVGHQLIEIKATKIAIGGYKESTANFINNTVPIQKNDTLYIFTDGFADQFNPKDEKLMTRRFKETILSIQDKPMNEQGEYLKKFILEWRGNVEQTDDILVIGIRV